MPDLDTTVFLFPDNQVKNCEDTAGCAEQVNKVCHQNCSEHLPGICRRMQAATDTRAYDSARKQTGKAVTSVTWKYSGRIGPVQKAFGNSFL